MKSKLKFIIIGAVVIILLAAVVIFLNVTEVEEEPVEETAAVEEESRLLYDKDPQSISLIHVENETGSYDIERSSDGESWGISEFEGHRLYSSGITGALSAAATLTAQQIVKENCDDLSIYGLDNPRLKITVEFDTDTKSILVGNEVPTGSNSYFCFDGENTVYTVKTSSLSCFEQDKYYYVLKTVYTAKTPEDENDTTDYTKINSITISRKDIDYDIVLEYDVRQDDTDSVTGNSSSHIMTYPVELDLNPDTANDTLTGVFGLEANSIAVLSPTEEDLEEYGLADPFAEVDFDIVGGDFTLTIGNKTEDGSGYYAMAEDFDIIFVFESSSLPWATVMPLDITMTLITSTYIYNVESINISTPEDSYRFTLNGDPDNFAVKCSSSPVSADLFKSYYQFLLRAPAEELYLAENTDEAAITVTIVSTDGTDTLEFIPVEGRMTVIRLNGRTSFKCRTAYTERLIENLGHLMNGEDIITVW